MIYIADPLQVSVSFHVWPAVSRKPYPPAEYSSKEGELFEHLRYPDSGALHSGHRNCYTVLAQWSDTSALDLKRIKWERRLFKCLRKRWPEGAACAARNLFRIARAVEAHRSRLKVL